MCAFNTDRWIVNVMYYNFLFYFIVPIFFPLGSLFIFKFSDLFVYTNININVWFKKIVQRHQQHIKISGWTKCTWLSAHWNSNCNLYDMFENKNKRDGKYFTRISLTCFFFFRYSHLREKRSVEYRAKCLLHWL